MLKNSEIENPSLSSTVETSKSRFFTHQAASLRSSLSSKENRATRSGCSYFALYRKRKKTDFEQTKYQLRFFQSQGYYFYQKLMGKFCYRGSLTIKIMIFACSNHQRQAFDSAFLTSFFDLVLLCRANQSVNIVVSVVKLNKQKWQQRSSKQTECKLKFTTKLHLQFLILQIINMIFGPNKIFGK